MFCISPFFLIQKESASMLVKKWVLCSISPRCCFCCLLCCFFFKLCIEKNYWSSWWEVFDIKEHIFVNNNNSKQQLVLTKVRILKCYMRPRPLNKSSRQSSLWRYDRCRRLQVGAFSIKTQKLSHTQNVWFVFDKNN